MTYLPETLQNQTTLLFLSIGIVLIVAWFIGLSLKYKVGLDKSHPLIDNLNLRIKSWCKMVAVIWIAFLMDNIGMVLLFAVISFCALREFLTIAPTRRSDHKVLILSFAFFLPFQYHLIMIEWYGMYTLLIPVYAFLFLPVIAALTSDTNKFLERTATIQWGLMLSVFCISHAPALFMLKVPGYESHGALMLIFLILIVQSSDVLQYVWGKIIGKHKISTKVSPSKTVEGLIGGVLSASVIGAALWWLTPFQPLQAFVVSLTITLVGFLGGLVMSAIKRDRGIKDWGSLIEGHGGMLDRLDSICFAAPVFFHIVRYWWIP